VLGGDVTARSWSRTSPTPPLGVTVRGERMRLDSRRNCSRSSSSCATAVLPGDRHARGAGPAQLAGRIGPRFNSEMTRSLDRWLDMADGNLRAGRSRASSRRNDDIFEIDPIWSRPQRDVRRGEGHRPGRERVTMIRWATPTRRRGTPTRGARKKLATRIDAVRRRSDIGGRYSTSTRPPYGTGLDEHPS